MAGNFLHKENQHSISTQQSISSPAQTWTPTEPEPPLWRKVLKRTLPRWMISLYRAMRRPRDPIAVARFIFRPIEGISLLERINIAKKIHDIQISVPCVHYQHEIISFFEAAVSVPKDRRGCLVEAGCYKGGSTAKFSLIAKASGQELIAFDSFEGIPDNDEPHDKDIWGYNAALFPGGSWSGSLEEVRRCVDEWGEPDSCNFIKGWFEETMPEFSSPVTAAFLDVDLASSTKTCLKHLYPLLVPGGAIISQDGHLPLVLEVFESEEFWRNDVGVPKPKIERIGHKLLRVIKAPHQETLIAIS